jgi:cytochrome P450
MENPVPGPRLPGALALLSWMAAPEKTFRDGFREHGDLYAVNNPLYGREVIVNHPELIKQVFTGDPAVYHGGAANFALVPVVGDLSVIVLDGAGHHRMRKLLLPAFTGDRLAAYAPAMAEATRRATAAWLAGTYLRVLPTMQRVTFDVILDTIFGVHEGAQMEALRTRLLGLVERAQSPLGMLWLLPALQKDLGPLTGWAALKRAVAAADEAIYAIVAGARAAHVPSKWGSPGRASEAVHDGGSAGSAGSAPKPPGRGRDVLSALLDTVDEEGRRMSDRELRDQLMTLLLAGHETTAISLAWAVDEIVRRPEVLGRILEEVRGSAAGPGDPLPYLDATIKEVLRLHPVTPLLARRLTAPVTLRGYEVPAGTFLVLNAFIAQRHPDYWEDPDAFRPERFLDKDRRVDPYAWIPFGGGARRCIGMSFALLEMRVVLGTLFSTLRLSPAGKPAALTLRSFLFAPKDGARVVLEGRN